MNMSNKSRRNFLKASIIAASGISLSGAAGAALAGSGGLPLKVAGYDYDRVKGIMDGRASIEGADDMQWIETTKSSDAGELTGSGWRAIDKDGKSPYFLPPDFPLSPGPAGVDESELLLSGRFDAIITAITPYAYLEGDPKIRRLFPDVESVEKQYFKKTGLFPIMHVVGVRTDSINENPWLPMAVFDMYVKAKRFAYADLETTTSLKVTLPWVTQEYEQTRQLIGDDYWSYGIAANRKELEHVMRYTHEQGLVKRRMDFEEMFHTVKMSNGFLPLASDASCAPSPDRYFSLILEPLRDD